MNKKGLTFMSFAIAVICLGLVLIAIWPKVNKIIDDSSENIFTNKVKDMITGIGKTYVNQDSRSFSNVIGGIPELKDINKTYQYIINLNDSGKVSSFKVTNGKYKIEGQNSDGVEVDEIGHKYAVFHSNTKFILTSDGKFEEE